MNLRGLLTAPLGFLIGLSLGALGGGGSILAVPVLVYAAGLDVRQATTVSLLIVGSASVVGMVGHYRGGRVQVGTGIAFGAAGIGGSLAGSWANDQLDPDLLLLAFAGLVLVAAWRMLSHCPSCTRAGEEAELEAIDDPASREGHGLATATRRDHRIDASQVVKLVVAGTFVGFLTGLFGVGGGFVIVPALTLLLGLTMPAAIGTSLLVIAINSAVALIPRLDGAQVDWAVAVPFIVSTIAGVVTGSRLAGKLDPDKSLRAFAALLVAVAVYTGIQAILGLA